MRKPPREEGLRWLSQAIIDLEWAKHLVNEGGYHLACFLAQQVTEKALKASLYAKGVESILGHSVVRLGVDAGSYYPEISEKVKRWAILDSFYITARYPNGIPDGIPAEVFNKETAENAVKLADEAVQYVRGLIE
jgi:HEPN domain-containing protein